MTAITKLLPCPLCGGDAHVTGPSFARFVQCRACYTASTSRHEDDEVELVAIWNTRAPSAGEAEASRELDDLRVILNQQAGIPAIEDDEEGVFRLVHRAEDAEERLSALRSVAAKMAEALTFQMEYGALGVVGERLTSQALAGYAALQNGGEP